MIVRCASRRPSAISALNLVGSKFRRFSTSLEKIAAIPVGNRSRAQALKPHHAFLAQAAPDDLKQACEKLVGLKRERQKFEDDLPTLMVMEEMSKPRPAFLLKRGAYDAPGERVERGVPAALPPMPAEFPNNRLGFARWLVSADHPLTSRVAVNRFWQMLFGSTNDPRALRSAFPLDGVCQRLPSPVLQCPDLLAPQLEELSPHNLSCAELALANAQGLIVNQRVAAEAADYLARLLLHQNLRRFATYFDLASGSVKNCYITPSASDV